MKNKLNTKDMTIKTESEILQGEKSPEWNVELGESGGVDYLVRCYSLNKTTENIIKYGVNYPFHDPAAEPPQPLGYSWFPTESFDFRSILFDQYIDDVTTNADYLNQRFGTDFVDTMTDEQILLEVPIGSYLVIK